MTQSFIKLVEKLNIDNPVSKVKVICYEKSKIPSELHEFNATGNLGEIFSFKDKVFLGLGDLDGYGGNKIGFMPAIEIQKAMPVLYQKIEQNFPNCEIEFEADVNWYGLCLNSFILASYSYKKEFEGKKFKLVYDKERYQEVVDAANIQHFVRLLGDTPANLMTPEIFVEYVGDGDIDYNLNPSYWKRD